MSIFSNLSESETTVLIHTPLYVGLLIAYADGEANHNELEWIGKVTLFRTKTAHHSLRKYYTSAHDIVVANMNLIQSELPSEHTSRLSYLSDKVAASNSALAKLEEPVRERLIDSFQSLALSVAEISGGLLHFFSRNEEEQKWLSLPMIQRP